MLILRKVITGDKMAIKKCTCKHKDQDKRYGIGNRVHNAGRGVMQGKSSWVCTVCRSRK
jgi:hypothetical protein